MDKAKTKPSSNPRALSRKYEPARVEERWYDWWDVQGYFQAPIVPGKQPFVIIMPPPNVTGSLHMGHALFVTVEDILARWHRMLGDPTLWLPGADHAGIAGQWVVERELAEEGLTRHDLGRDKFLERVWDWMDRYRGRIREQMRLLGASCDWSHFVFTMDPAPSRAVRTAFKRLYDKGLIYQGERLINWCPRCMTALSDLEVNHEEVHSSLWTLRYPIVGTGDEEESQRFIEVATTRPETMLGDTAVAVNPDDERYRDLVGLTVHLPLLGRIIPIVADPAVDPAFGTGAVKVTPAHDPNDFEIGQRHNLPAITVINHDGTMNAEAGPFAGMTVEEARKAVVRRLELEGYLAGTQLHTHAVGTCDRCGTVVQPLISRQWFLTMQPLAEPAIQVVKDGTVHFIPDRFTGIYLNWMENIHDWCISRQLWWGHRIPVWYCRDCGEMIVTDQESVERCGCGSSNIYQDPDVLDTWFSSGLWTFSTLGWPDDTEELRYFYPGSVMETGYEIIFFWVARMIFFGLEFMGQVPFHDVYLHGTVRDELGQKMSKTKGNVIDPIDVTQQYGSDALRFALITAGGAGTDSKLSLSRVEAARNFGTKLWNATRYVLRALESGEIAVDESGAPLPPDFAGAGLADRWIVSRLQQVSDEVQDLMLAFKFDESSRRLYDFFWSEFADWYIEASKPAISGGDPVAAPAARQTLTYVLERALRLLHPVMPFVTEELWHAIPHGGESLMLATWPRGEAALIDPSALREFGFLMEAIRTVRNARAETGVEPERWISAQVFPGSHSAAFEQAADVFHFLARIGAEQLELRRERQEAGEGTLTLVVEDAVIALPLAGMVDLDAERERLRKEIDEVEAEIARTGALLDNPNFVERAPESVVAKHRERLSSAQERLALLQSRLGELGG